MKKKRLIPVLLLKNGVLVQSKGFARHPIIGNPFSAVQRLSDWAADELIYLDISRTDKTDAVRDSFSSMSHQSFDEIIADIARVATMPITVGGRIHSLKDIEIHLKNGADKIAINSIAVSNPSFISEAAHEFGSQCIVVSVDVKLTSAGVRVVTERGTHIHDITPLEWCSKVAEFGAGEILLNSIDRDGKKVGYDLELLNCVSKSVAIPVIALGGVGAWSDFADALNKTNVDAVAAANVFHHSDQSVYMAKKYLFDQGFNVRRPAIENN